MYIKQTEIINASGLHARPAGTFVQNASKFKSKITIQNLTTGKIANAKSIITILTLALTKGTKVELTADGEDEIVAIDTLVQLLEEGCGE